jgi:PEP-CTERM motif
MRIVILLALLLFANTAGATTLEITSGSITHLFFGIAVVSAAIGGPGFSATMFDDDHISFFSQPSGGISFSHIPGNTIFDMNALVTVGSDTCGGFVQTDFYFCGSLSTFAPDIPLSERVLGASSPPLPFTATGHFNVGPGYDVVGQGTVIATYNSSVLSPDFHFTFAVPEPSTLVLLVSGLALIAWRRRQA